jgi:hypothetical protein
MESTKRTKDQANLDVSNQGGTATSPANQKDQTTGSSTPQSTQHTPSNVGQHQPSTNVSGKSMSDTLRDNDTIQQAKQAATDAYNRASQGVSDTYTQALDYGKENPGKMALIAFGAGIGIGLLLANGFSTSNRTDRIMPPVMNALSAIASEFLR